MNILVTYVEVKNGFPTLSYWKLPQPQTDAEFNFIKSMDGFFINESDPALPGYAAAIAFQGATKNCTNKFYKSMIQNFDLPKSFYTFTISKYGVYQKCEFNGGQLPGSSYIITTGYVVSEED